MSHSFSPVGHRRRPPASRRSGGLLKAHRRRSTRPDTPQHLTHSPACPDTKGKEIPAESTPVRTLSRAREASSWPGRSVVCGAGARQRRQHRVAAIRSVTSGAPFRRPSEPGRAAPRASAAAQPADVARKSALPHFGTQGGREGERKRLGSEAAAEGKSEQLGSEWKLRWKWGRRRLRAEGKLRGKRKGGNATGKRRRCAPLLAIESSSAGAAVAALVRVPLARRL